MARRSGGQRQPAVKRAARHARSLAIAGVPAQPGLVVQQQRQSLAGDRRWSCRSLPHHADQAAAPSMCNVLRWTWLDTTLRVVARTCHRRKQHGDAHRRHGAGSCLADARGWRWIGAGGCGHAAYLHSEQWRGRLYRCGREPHPRLAHPRRQEQWDRDHPDRTTLAQYGGRRAYRPCLRRRSRWV